MNSPVRMFASRHAALRAACSAGLSLLFAATVLTGIGVTAAQAATTSPTAAPSAGGSSGATPAGGATTATTLQPEVPSVYISPTNTTVNDPDGGQWFFFSLKPGQSGSTQARITNPADVPQTVQVSINDLSFTSQGTGIIDYGKQTDVGSWAHFDVSSVTIPAKSSVLVPFYLTVASNAEPGDHFGVVVTRSAPEALKGSRALRLVNVIATRLYVTVPGLATKSFQIGQINGKLNSTLLPSYSLVTVPIINTGRVRLTTHVTIGGVRASGSPIILAKSTELYTAKVHVPIYGGPVNENVVVTTNYAGVSRSASHSQFVFPVAGLALLLLLGLLGFGFLLLVRARIRKQRRLRADIRRLEQMVLQRPGMTATQGPSRRKSASESAHDVEDAASLGAGEAEGDGEDRGPSGGAKSAAVVAMESAIKRARRTGHKETLPELAIALHEAGGDALDVLLEALSSANGRAPKVMNALAAYPAERIQASPRLAKLSESDRARLVSKGTGAVGEFGAGPRGNSEAASGGSEEQPQSSLRPRSRDRKPRQPVR